MPPRRPSDAQDFDALMDLLEDPRAQILMEQLAKSAAEHVLLRIGIDAANPQGVIEHQSTMATLKDMRAERIIVQERLSNMEIRQKEHETSDAAQFQHVISNQILATQDRTVMIEKLEKNKKELTDKIEEYQKDLNKKIDANMNSIHTQLVEVSKNSNRVLIALLSTIVTAIISGMALKLFG